MIKRFGFTLAEVLITLGIIGVVAAMTIPTLVSQTGQAEFKTGLKKAVSVLNQAITMNVALDNTDFSGLTDGDADAEGSIYHMFTTRMNVVEGITGATTAMGATAIFNVPGNYTLFFNDGMAITFPQDAASCTETSKCDLVVDVNGRRRPNTLSQATADNTTAIGDQFQLEFFDQRVEPADDFAKYLLYN